ncbi:MAG: hypothetical protein U1E13_10935 [Methylophilaceae bacterium]|nr:hypothetical protein [Methylophilaceae bacterium]
MLVDKRQFTHALLLLLCCILLSGCMGAPLAQQLLSSVVLNSADRLMADAHEAQERDALNNRVLPNTEPDEYWGSFVTAGFRKITPIEEPLPASVRQDDAKSVAMLEVSPFVRVEVWNMLVGEEKQAVLEKAYAMGNKDIPPKEEWVGTRVATGALEGREDQPIIFLVPDELGRITSGQQTIVELADPGDLSIARYAAN